MRGSLLVFSLVLLWPSAMAAPWIQEEGALYTRVSLANEEVEGLQGWRGDAYAEYGVSEFWTVTAKLEGVAYEEASDFNGQGWRVTARRRLYQRGTFNMTTELGLLQGEAIGGRNGCETLGAETRAGASWSGEWRKRQTFTFAEIAGRFHNGCNRQRYEFGFGQQASKHIWNVTQVWIERGDTNTKSDKVQSELLWRGDFADYSIGYRNENGGRFREESIFLAFAKRF